MMVRALDRVTAGEGNAAFGSSSSIGTLKAYAQADTPYFSLMGETRVWARSQYSDVITVGGTGPVTLRFTMPTTGTFSAGSYNALGHAQLSVGTTSAELLLLVYRERVFNGASTIENNITSGQVTVDPGTQIYLGGYLVADARVINANPNALMSGVDFGHTSESFIEVLTPGGSVSSQSGHNYAPVPESSMAAAILPSSRSVMVGTGATAFATIINLGPGPATACGLSLPAGVPAAFMWQTTNGLNVPVGTPETPVDLAAGGSQSFVFSVTPSAAFTQDVAIGFDCADTAPAPVVPGLDTLLLVVSDQAVPDIVALAATVGGDGIVRVPGPPGSGAFAVATVNVGVAGTIHVSADTGPASLPVSLFVCETNPGTGACLADPAAGVVTTIGAGATPTFAVFVPATGEVAFAPATSRVFLRFAEFAPWAAPGSAPRGATSVAVCTGALCPSPP